jgi:prepilin-type N-terminal cleavage/methylation domain-containing protein
MKRGFTLLELLTVIIIIGILATLGITHYGGIKEKALDKEAIANLKLIIAAEKIYRMENATQSWYLSGPGSPPQIIRNINDNLKLSLPAGDNRSWNYWVTYLPCGPPFPACAVATRNGADARMWEMIPSQEEPRLTQSPCGC